MSRSKTLAFPCPSCNERGLIAESHMEASAMIWQMITDNFETIACEHCSAPYSLVACSPDKSTDGQVNLVWRREGDRP